MQNVIDAMGSLQTERDTWKLADALYVIVPKGGEGMFQPIVDAAVTMKVGFNNKGQAYTAKNLVQYRDVAKAWPAEKRVVGVSFTAHREVSESQAVAGGIEGKRKFLENQVTVQAGQPGKVTTTVIRKAIQASKGVVPPAPPTTVPAPPKAVDNVLDDLRLNGGQKLIDAIPKGTSLEELDQLKKGLNAVLVHIDKLQSSYKRDQAAKKAAASAPSDEQIQERSEAIAVKAKGKGDFRGLRGQQAGD
jgi:hypothetical protein